MPINQNTERRVEGAMSSLDGIQKVTPRPFFYTRLQARLAASENSGWEKISAFIAKPAIAFMVLSLIVLINTWALLKYTHSSNSTKSFSQQTEQISSEEYALAGNYYTDETP